VINSGKRRGTRRRRLNAAIGAFALATLVAGLAVWVSDVAAEVRWNGSSAAVWFAALVTLYVASVPVYLGRQR
jgi:hypothetical protein